MTIYNDNSLREILLKNNEGSDSDFYNKLKIFEEHIDELSEESRFLVYLNLGNVLCFKLSIQDIQNALDYALKAEELIENRRDNLKSEFFFLKGNIYARMSFDIESKASFIKYIYYNFRFDGGFNHTVDLVDNNIRIENSYLSFRPINKYLMSDLINEEITLTDPENFNDPFDTLLYKYLEFNRMNVMKNSGYDISPLYKAYKHIRVRCFVKAIPRPSDKIVDTFRNILMWSHYADDHKGICVRYKFDFCSNQNIDSGFRYFNWYHIAYCPEIVLDNVIPSRPSILLSTKHDSWRYEQEVRLLHFEPNSNDSHIHVPLAKLGGQVEAVFFGLKCEEHDKETIKSILGGNVKYFEFNNEIASSRNIFELKLKDESELESLSKRDFYKCVLTLRK